MGANVLVQVARGACSNKVTAHFFEILCAK